MGMKESGGDTIVLLRPAVALPPLTRKAKAKKATNPPDAKPRACSEEIHNPSRKERSTPQQQLPPQPPSPRPNRRGRPPKTSLTQQKQHSVSKAVAPRLADKRRASASFIDSSLSATDYSPSNSDKKTLLRARNREAAHKCRVRKQRGIEDLQTQEASLEGVNQCLKDQYTDLRDEVLLLKDMILQHGSCGCSFIESYIEDAAANISQNPDAFTTSHHLVSNSAISPTDPPRSPQLSGDPLALPDGPAPSDIPTPTGLKHVMRDVKQGKNSVVFHVTTFDHQELLSERLHVEEGSWNVDGALDKENVKLLIETMDKEKRTVASSPPLSPSGSGILSFQGKGRTIQPSERS
ncbi:hypothetical protein VdG1_00198 [Verticillium dahliae VDG1]|nr:hypothetical protein VdG1_00198 [Verticillium dahliae VDG1]